MKEETKNVLEQLKHSQKEVKRLEKKALKLIRWDLISLVYIGNTELCQKYKEIPDKNKYDPNVTYFEGQMNRGYFLTTSTNIDDCDKLSFIETCKGRNEYVLHYKDNRESVKKIIPDITMIYEKEHVLKSLLEDYYPYETEEEAMVAGEKLKKLQEKYFV